MSKHNVLGFCIYSIIGFPRPGLDRMSHHPYGFSIIYDVLDIYDQRDSSRLLKILHAHELNVDGFTGYDHNESEGEFTGVRFSDATLIHFKDYGDFEYVRDGFDPVFQPVAMFKAPYPLTDEHAAVRNQYYDEMRTVVAALGKEYQLRGNAESPGVIYNERFVGGGLQTHDIPFDTRSRSRFIEADGGTRIEVDPDEPIYDSSAGEQGGWIYPDAPPFDFPSQG